MALLLKYYCCLVHLCCFHYLLTKTRLRHCATGQHQVAQDHCGGLSPCAHWQNPCTCVQVNLLSTIHTSHITADTAFSHDSFRQHLHPPPQVRQCLCNVQMSHTSFSLEPQTTLDTVSGSVFVRDAYSEALSASSEKGNLLVVNAHSNDLVLRAKKGDIAIGACVACSLSAAQAVFRHAGRHGERHCGCRQRARARDAHKRLALQLSVFVIKRCEDESR